jgi:hypothetical protein
MKRRLGVAKRDFLTHHYPDWTWQSPDRVIGVDGTRQVSDRRGE